MVQKLTGWVPFYSETRHELSHSSPHTNFLHAFEDLFYSDAHFHAQAVVRDRTRSFVNSICKLRKVILADIYNRLMITNPQSKTITLLASNLD